MEQPELEKAITEIKAKIGTYKLNINRLPKRAYDDFVLLADEEFCSDYGFTLKFLLDFYQGLIPSGLEAMQNDISVLKAEVGELKSKSNNNQEKIRKTLSGIVIKQGEK